MIIFKIDCDHDSPDYVFVFKKYGIIKEIRWSFVNGSWLNVESDIINTEIFEDYLTIYENH